MCRAIKFVHYLEPVAEISNNVINRLLFYMSTVLLVIMKYTTQLWVFLHINVIAQKQIYHCIFTYFT